MAHAMRKALMISVILWSWAAQAQTPRDYYAAQLNQHIALELQTVERLHLHPGAEHVRNRRYQAAWADFDFVLRHFPNHPRGLVMMGDLCLQWKSPRCDASKYFDDATAVNPNAPGTLVARGIYLHKRNHVKDAVESYKAALKLDEDSLNAHYNLALAYIALKDYPRANEHAQRAYALGATPPGLRDKLKAAGAWKPTDVPRASTK